MSTKPKLTHYKEPLKSILEKTAKGLSEAGRLRQAYNHIPAKSRYSLLTDPFQIGKMVGNILGCMVWPASAALVRGSSIYRNSAAEGRLAP